MLQKRAIRIVLDYYELHALKCYLVDFKAA